MMKKNLLLKTWDLVGLPFRIALFKQDWLPSLGWTTLEEERILAVLPHISGRLLDVGAGNNNLVRRYGDGVGIDVFDWGSGVQIVENTADLPFESASFDTIAFVACLNHIPYRQEALREARRLIRPEGRLILTMINPVLGGIGHAIWWYGEDRQRDGMKEGEVGGLWTRDVIRLGEKASFRLLDHRRFVYGMNHLYLFEPVAAGDRTDQSRSLIETSGDRAGKE